MDEEELLGTSDDENTIQETLQQNGSPATFFKHLVNRFGIIGHHNIGSETVNLPDNLTIKINYSTKLVDNRLLCRELSRSAVLSMKCVSALTLNG